MKKVKLMLLSLSILAIVAAALAFTVKGNARLCTALPDSSFPFCDKDCPNDNRKLKLNTGSGNSLCTAPTNGNSANPCQGVHCLNSAEYDIEP